MQLWGTEMRNWDIFNKGFIWIQTGKKHFPWIPLHYKRRIQNVIIGFIFTHLKMRDCSDKWSVVNKRVTLGEDASSSCYTTYFGAKTREDCGILVLVKMICVHQASQIDARHEDEDDAHTQDEVDSVKTMEEEDEHHAHFQEEEDSVRNLALSQIRASCGYNASNNGGR
jgi:hypothetical protein